MKTPLKPKRYLIYHPDEGVLLGYDPGPPRKFVWSHRMPPGGANAAPTCSTRHEAERVTAAIKATRRPGARRFKIVPCKPDHGALASVYACVAAGLPAWLPGIPGVNASDEMWRAFIKKSLGVWCEECRDYHHEEGHNPR